MTPEIKTDEKLPDDVLNETATNLFNRTLEVLKARGIEKPCRIDFESKGANYTLNLEKQTASDWLTISTINEGMEERICISLLYKAERELDQANFHFLRFDREGDSPTEYHANSAIANEKIRLFLRQI